MKAFTSFFLLIAALSSLALAWTSEDHEIFRLRDELIKAEGDNVTFYSFLGVKPSATFADIKRANRKLSQTLHPDKALHNWLENYAKDHEVDSEGSSYRYARKEPTKREIRQFKKTAEERSARLTLIVNALREDRKRYDHFLANGFPKWRGTGYYYTRFRPGLGSVLLGLFVVFGGGFHYLALWMGWRKQKEFVHKLIRNARSRTWGDRAGNFPGAGVTLGNIPGLDGGAAATPAESEEEGTPAAQAWNRREKRALAKEKRREDKKPLKKSAAAAEQAREGKVSAPQDVRLGGPVGAKKRTMAENGKVLIVDSQGNVWLEEETEEGDMHEFLLDPEEILRPTIFDTALFKLPKWTYTQTVGRFLNPADADLELEQIVDDATRSTDDAALNSATSINANGEARKRRAKAGRR